MNPLVVISLHNEKLRVSADPAPDGGFKAVSKDLLPNEVSNPSAVASRVLDILYSFYKSIPKKARIHFLIEPQDTFAVFISTRKGSDEEVQILQEITKKFENVKLDDLYYSYQKIAPFVYQFIGVKKDILGRYLKIGESLDLSVVAAIPWVLLLPRFVNKNSPGIFLCKRDGAQVMVLSELNGVYFSGELPEDYSAEHLQKLVQNLSVYDRKSVISDVYTMDFSSISLGDGYKVSELPILSEGSSGEEDFKCHVLFELTYNANPELLDSQLNVFNIIPSFLETKKPLNYVYVGGIVGALLLLVSAVAGFTILSKDTPFTVGKKGSAVVLSEVEQSTQTSEKQLDKSELKIMVENASRINGLAAKTRDFLTDLGYVVVDVRTSDDVRDGTLVKIKKDKAEFKSFLINDLKADFGDVTVEEELDASSSYDVLVILGS